MRGGGAVRRRSARARTASGALLGSALGRRTFLAVTLTTIPAGGLAAQDDPFARQPSSAGVALDSALVAGSLHPIWRGLLLGTVGVRAFVDVALAGRPVTAVGPWGLAAHVGGMVIGDRRSAGASPGHVEGGLTLSRYFTGDGAAGYLVLDGYHLPTADFAASGVEVGLGLADIVWEWGLEEVAPEIGLAVYRDWGRFDAFRADADFDLGFGIQNVAFGGFRDVAGWLSGRVTWSGYEAGDEFAWRAGAGGALDRGLWTLALSGGVQNPLDAGLGGWGELALRVWPAGGDLP
jgi:hypothetical protein